MIFPVSRETYDGGGRLMNNQCSVSEALCVGAIAFSNIDTNTTEKKVIFVSSSTAAGTVLGAAAGLQFRLGGIGTLYAMLGGASAGFTLGMIKVVYDECQRPRGR